MITATPATVQQLRDVYQLTAANAKPTLTRWGRVHTFEYPFEGQTLRREFDLRSPKRIIAKTWIDGTLDTVHQAYC